MARMDGAHPYKEGKRGKKGVGIAVAVIVAVLAIAAILFFWLFDVDAAFQSDVDAPEVQVNPEDEAEEGAGG